MTSLKLGSTLSPQVHSLRPAVERSVTTPSAEVATAARPVVSRDEFVSGAESPQRFAALPTEDSFQSAPAGETSRSPLSEALEPFREALDQIVDQVRQDPSLLLDPGFLRESFEKLGIAAKDFAEALTYVSGLYAQNTGKDRVAQAPVVNTTTA